MSVSVTKHVFPYRPVSVSSHLSFVVLADLPPQTSQLLSRAADGVGGQGGGTLAVGVTMNDRELQTQLLSLKQQHQVQQQLLLQQFHEQQVRLVQEQDKQVADHIQVRTSYTSLGRAAHCVSLSQLQVRGQS